jgi:phenylalanyl-tRNA synthetase beta chain
MPKIEVYADALYKYAEETYDDAALEEIFQAGKAELDEKDEARGLLKIELNDTNRPDLWSAAGIGRQLRAYKNGKAPVYDFFSTPGNPRDYGERVVKVDHSVREVRPYEIAIAATGKKLDDASLKDLIQTQEKLCWNFGRKRRSIAIGVFRSDLLTYPITYRAADPDETRFVPLQMEKELSLRQMLSEHPKGREYGHIIEGFHRFPYLEDAKGETLSFPPVINSAYTGAVEVGDENLFIEMTGTELKDLILTANMVACDLADAGFTILPVKIEYPFETEFGREIVSPFYFQEPLSMEIEYANRLLGVNLGGSEMTAALAHMGIRAEADNERVTIEVPPYRNDFLHPVDIIEDLMIGRGMDSFEPVMPSDFTVGRLTEEEEFARQVKEIMIGMGFQEMMYNYLGSRKNFVEKMGIDDREFVRIANPMTENYEFLRSSILPNLLESESVSAHAVYPHHIFEIGKVAFLDPDDNSGTATRNYLGFLSADREISFNEVSAFVSAIFYYTAREYTLEELEDPRFIPGRAARILYQGSPAGIFGEVHPQVLENWGITMPAIACEIDLDVLLHG